MHRTYTRRTLLAALGLGALALGPACQGSRPQLGESALEPASDHATETPTMPTPSSTPTARPTATPTPTPTPRPAGLEQRTLLPDTPWETIAYIRSSGVQGPALMVLGGVHGNEPAGWLAADDIATWEPAAGVIAVVPRANVLAIAEFARLIDGEGDLNRQYPGNPDADLPTSRLAAEFTELARELRVDVLLDLHESWAFYVDRESDGFVNRSQAGTAYLGQTLTSSGGPSGHHLASDIAAIVNASIPTEREQFIARDRWSLGGGSGTNRGTSSLSLGAHVPGLTPVLVETAQRGQALERRTELQLTVVRATMDILGI